MIFESSTPIIYYIYKTAPVIRAFKSLERNR
jgi:hypothetical protein